MKNLSIIAVSIAFAMLFSKCSKEGPEGPQGIQGEQGIQGDQGVPGADGNANVHSYLYTVVNWTPDGVDLYDVLAASYITQDILDNGAVLVYMSNGSGAWNPLPYVEWRSSYEHLITPVIAVGSITLWISDSDLTLPGIPGATDYKVVAIQGTTKAAISAKVDINDYFAVAKYLKLK
jgi:hypothetical protein